MKRKTTRIESSTCVDPLLLHPSPRLFSSILALGLFILSTSPSSSLPAVEAFIVDHHSHHHCHYRRRIGTNANIHQRSVSALPPSILSPIISQSFMTNNSKKNASTVWRHATCANNIITSSRGEYGVAGNEREQDVIMTKTSSSCSSSFSSNIRTRPTGMRTVLSSLSSTTTNINRKSNNPRYHNANDRGSGMYTRSSSSRKYSSSSISSTEDNYLYASDTTNSNSVDDDQDSEIDVVGRQGNDVEAPIESSVNVEAKTKYNGDGSAAKTEVDAAAVERAVIVDDSSMTQSTNSNNNAKMQVIRQQPKQQNNMTPYKFRTSIYDLFQAGVVGSFTGLSVALFKLSIEALREICYQQDYLARLPFLVALIPAFGGLSVGLLLLLGKFPPGLRGTVKEVDDDAGMVGRGGRLSSTMPMKDLVTLIRAQLSFVRKSVAAVFTLGTGCSLGPEGPCVEIGMSVSRAVMDIHTSNSIGGRNSVTRQRRKMTWNRLLLSCGAAAGVAAGFNAPIAGVFFALEVMQNAFSSIHAEQQQEQLRQDDSDNDSDSISFTSEGMQSMTNTATITPILISSVLSALIARTLLGNHLVLALTEYSLKTPLIELPLYLLLGALSGVVAFAFSRLATTSQSFFDGKLGSDRARATMQSIPSQVKPVIGGLLCGIVGLAFPQILFFGYETLNALLANNSLPTTLVLSLLGVKMAMTAVSAASGLVGGTFAPSLFLGAMTGASFHNIMSWILVLVMNALTNVGLIVPGPVLELADVPAYAMIGSASVLAALFRAPLTASLLLFELTRDYDVILPLMASAGVGSLVGDILENKFERLKEKQQRRDQDPVSWGDLADRTQESEAMLVSDNDV